MGTCLSRFSCGWRTWRGVSGQEWEACQTVRQEVKPAEFLSNSLFKLELEGSEVSGKLGLGQRVMVHGGHY